MSPLDRSLLFALAALLVVVNAEKDCVVNTFGLTTDYPAALAPVGMISTDLTIPNACARQYGQGFMAVGETVKVCLYTHEQPPEISLVNPPHLSRVRVVCPDGCSKGGVKLNCKNRIIFICDPAKSFGSFGKKRHKLIVSGHIVPRARGAFIKSSEPLRYKCSEVEREPIEAF